MRLRLWAVTAVAVLLSFSPAFAQAPAGPQLAVNTYTSARQGFPSIGTDAAGNFVIAWQSYGQDGDRWGVFGQRFDAVGGRRGGEFQANTTTAIQQVMPNVVVTRDGFIVAWASGDFGVLDVQAQRYDVSGNRAGSEFRVNTQTGGRDARPAMGTDRQGNFVVTWSSFEADNTGYAVLSQRFDRAGERLGAVFLLNTYTFESQYASRVAVDASDRYVVTWTSRWQDPGNKSGVFGQRVDSLGNRLGGEFEANSYTTDYQWVADVCAAADGRFVVVWEDWAQPNISIYARRFDATGDPHGAEFRVNVATDHDMREPAVACDAAGNFVVAWERYREVVLARRFRADGTPRNGETLVSTGALVEAAAPAVASDAVGNFVVSWVEHNASPYSIVGQRFGGLQSVGLRVDPASNGVLEPGESVDLRPSWRNVRGAAQAFTGTGRAFSGPAASGVAYLIDDAAASYGTVPDGSAAECTDCYHVGVAFSGTRPAQHWDATLDELLAPDVLGQEKLWSVHIGSSFADVAPTNGFYRVVETLLHNGITGGCGPASYCPTGPTARSQMAVFVLLSREGQGYAPRACTTPVFDDVPASDSSCPWIEELARRGVTGGCGGRNFCPHDPVTREQMAVFLLRTLDPALSPPTCTTPVFGDVPASSPFCRWIEELVRRGITAGCSGGNYCPGQPVTREQMAAFLTGTFGLTLYGP